MSKLFSLLLLLQPQDDGGRKPPDVQDPIRNWVYQHFEKNRKTDDLELVATIRGDEMVPVDIVKKIFDVKGITADYFTEPTKREKSQKIGITAGKARFDDSAKQITLTEGVRVVTEDGGTLTTPSLTLLFEKRQFMTDEEFRLERPNVVISGKGLLADETLKQLTVREKGFTDVTGRPQDLVQPSDRPPKKMRTRLWSAGPMTIRDTGDEKNPNSRASVSGRGGIRLEREDEQGSAVLDADTVDVDLIRRVDEKTKQESVLAESAAAAGNIRGRTSTGGVYTGERMHWDMASGASLIEGAPLVTVRYGINRVAARRATSRTVPLDKPQQVFLLFEEDVTATVMPDDRPGGQPIDLTARRLLIELRPRGTEWEVHSIEALEEVTLAGLTGGEGDAPGKAACDRFFWDAAERRGLLEGAPLVEITQGESRILAPRALVSGSGTVVLQGLKRLLLVQGEKRYSITSAGDILMDPAGHRIQLRDRCSVKSKEFTLQADRVDVILSADGRSVAEVRAAGHVSARRAKEATTLYGDRLKYDMAGGWLEVVGWPNATVVQGPATVETARIRYSEKDESIELFRGKKPIRITREEP